MFPDFSQVMRPRATTDKVINSPLARKAPQISPMSTTNANLDQIAINTLRTLSIDMVQSANSGHPGLPLGAAPLAYTVYQKFLKFNPADPEWFDRDRFILSPGHGSALIYSLLHLFGYEVELNELKQFRQLGSNTPGHPEFGMTPGIECTTGPLGQGFANGIGMAIAEQWLASRYNVGGAKVVDHYTYAIVSDGDLMEGVAIEAASLAGHLKLGKVIYLYDSNDISLDGPCDLSYTEDVKGKFESMGWQVLECADGNDLESLESAIQSAQQETEKPSLIVVKTEIGYASPLAGSSKSHGAPLGAEAVAATKTELGFDPSKSFFVPDEVKSLAISATDKGHDLVTNWDSELEKLRAFDPNLANEIIAISEGELPDNWEKHLDEITFEGKIATRDSGSTALNAIGKSIPWLIGGAADLASSTKTAIKDSPAFTPQDPSGRNIFFGVREHAMGAIVNGMALHGLRPFGSTFLVFSDYMRGSIRLAALTQISSTFVFTHDSVFVGEDGPTHQPIEHVSALRLIPNLEVWRPADAYETLEAWRNIVKTGSTACLALTRQGVPTLPDRELVKEGCANGGYILQDHPQAKAVIVATGSEVSLALETATKLAAEDIHVRIVSMPCREVFAMASPDYQEEVLPMDLPCIAVEAGVSTDWYCIADLVVGIDSFGESGPGDMVYRHLGMTPENIAEAVKSVL